MSFGCLVIDRFEVYSIVTDTSAVHVSGKLDRLIETLRLFWML